MGLPYMVVFTMLLSAANCTFPSRDIINNLIRDQFKTKGEIWSCVKSIFAEPLKRKWENTLLVFFLDGSSRKACAIDYLTLLMF